MRKLLINSTALATVAALTATVAVADVSISASTEYKYTSRSSLVTATDGTTGVSDSAVTLAFSNKTDNGLTVGYKVVMETEGGGMDADETSLTIAGGFGKVEMGEFDGVADTFGIAAVDLTAEESTDSVASANISTNSDVVNTDSDGTKIAYYLPAMGGLTIGASYTDEGAVASADTTDYGFAYVMEAGGSTVTFGGASTVTAVAATADIRSQNMGVKFVSGNLKVTVGQGTYDAVDEGRKATDVGVSYLLDNGITLGAFKIS
jgi:outer membrane protein OmpU